jgi:hypothetical protein
LSFRNVCFGQAFVSIQFFALGRCFCSAAASFRHPKLLALRSVGLAVVLAQSLKHGAAQAPNSSFKADGFAAA